MSRFQYGVSKTKSPIKRLILSIGFFVLLFVFFLYATGSLSKGNVDRQKESLSNAINKDIVYHYATTGNYPTSLNQIRELYGLTYDEDLFFVDYDVRGQNIVPTVTIIEKKDKQ